MLGLGLSLTSRAVLGGGIAVPTILFSGSTVAEDAALDQVIGTLSVSNGSGSYTFTLTGSDGSRVSLTTATIKRGATALDYETHPTISFSVSADNGVDTPLTRTFNVTVTNVVEDTAPDAFSFTDVTDATRSTQYESNTITVAGIDGPANLTITGGEYSKNGGTYASGATTVVAGDTVKVRPPGGTSSGSYATAINVVLTIGGVSDTYTVTTEADPTVPATPTTPILTLYAPGPQPQFRITAAGLSAGDVAHIEAATDENFSTIVLTGSDTLSADQASGVDPTLDFGIGVDQAPDDYWYRVYITRGATQYDYSNTVSQTVPVPLEYTLRGTASSNSSSDTVSDTFDLGPAATDRLVVVPWGCQNFPGTDPVFTVGGSGSGTLTKIVQNGSGIYAGLVPTGTTGVTISMQVAGAEYFEKGFSVYTCNPESTTPAATRTGNGTIAVNSGDALFLGVNTATAVPNFSVSSQALNDNTALSPGGWHLGGLDASIVLANSAFSIDGGGGIAVVAAVWAAPTGGGGGSSWTPADLGSKLIEFYDIKNASWGSAASYTGQHAGINAVQATSGSQPVFNANGFGTGDPSLDFDGSDDFLDALFTMTAAPTLWMAAKFQMSTGDGRLFIIVPQTGSPTDYAEALGMMLAANGGLTVESYRQGMGSGTGGSISAYDTTTYILSEAGASGLMVTLDNTASAFFTGPNDGSNFASDLRFRIGAGMVGGSVSGFKHMKAGRVVLGTGVLTTDEKAALKTWVMA